MKISKLVGERKKETPQGVVAKSHELLLRAGFVKQTSNGSYSLFSPATKVKNKIIKIIREEMDAIDGQEVLFPVMMTRELWEESGRYDSIGNEMFRLKDRTGHDMVLGMTHEEAAVHLAKNSIKSYEQMPSMIYQVQTKLRDEQRPRAGLLRLKEFTMKDAYSFHATQDDLNNYYQKVYNAYERIFNRIGLKNIVAVESDSGMMGGSKAHEFMLLTQVGEDKLAVCNNCDYNANTEVAISALKTYTLNQTEKELVHTPNVKTIEQLQSFFGLDAKALGKAVVYRGEKTQKYYVVLIRADLQVNQVKLENLAGEQVAVTDDLSACKLVGGFIGPNFAPQENVVAFYDVSLKHEQNLIVGANKADYHVKGFCFNRDVEKISYQTLYEVASGHTCQQCQKGTLCLENGMEIGHIFQLGTKYTQSMNMTAHNNQGELFNPIMGCYGIGVDRAIACIIEENHDEKGIVWPVSVAPWQIYLAPIKADNKEVEKQTNQMYELLKTKGFEVLYDDRQTSPGVKFAESELMGIPIRIVISPRTIESKTFEVAVRSTGEKFNVEQSQLLETLNKFLQ